LACVDMLVQSSYTEGSDSFLLLLKLLLLLI
jgi:hypothetical protein